MPQEKAQGKRKRYTPSQARAAKKYLENSVEEIKVRVPKGQKDLYKKAAANAGESLNAFIIRAMDQRINEENLL